MVSAGYLLFGSPPQAPAPVGDGRNAPAAFRVRDGDRRSAAVAFPPRAMAYDAFISYSHAADGRLAPAVQAALPRLAKPWYRRRARLNATVPLRRSAARDRPAWPRSLLPRR